MQTGLHHVAVFVADIPKALQLFRDCLGFHVAWHVPEAGGRKLSALLGLPEVKAEIVYLEKDLSPVGLELVRLIHPPIEKQTLHFSASGTVSLSLVVDDLDGLYERIKGGSWTFLSPPLETQSPNGETVQVFFFRTEEGLNIELIQEIEKPSLSSPRPSRSRPS